MKSANEEKLAGHLNKAKGNIKEKAGKVLGKKSLEREGMGDIVKGKAQLAIGKVKGAVGSKVEKSIDRLEKKVK